MNTIFSPKFYHTLTTNPALQDLFNRFKLEPTPHPGIHQTQIIRDRVKQIINSATKTKPRPADAACDVPETNVL